MNLALHEVDHILKALQTMSPYDKKKVHDKLYDKLLTYRYRLTRP